MKLLARIYVRPQTNTRLRLQLRANETTRATTCAHKYARNYARASTGGLANTHAFTRETKRERLYP